MIPKVSVIVPCYGVEKYLDRCLESLVNQTLDDIEIILVDDGSPDKVPELCDKWALRDSRVKVVHKKNAGLGFARNSGLEIATGEFVAFVDSDDFVDQNMYKCLYEIAINKNTDAVFCGFKKEFSQGNFLNVQECSEYMEVSGVDVKTLIPDFIASEPYQKKEYKYEMSVWHSIYRRKIISDNNILFVSERVYSSEDIPFQIDFFTKAKKISFIPDVFYTYCWNGGSLTKRVSREKFEKIKSLYFLLKNKSVAYDPESLRVKRLFIGYIRAFIRTLVGMDIPKNEKRKFICDILKDEIWDEIRLYKPSFLPLHQRIFSVLMFGKHSRMTYLYARIMEFLK